MDDNGTLHNLKHSYCPQVHTIGILPIHRNMRTFFVIHHLNN